MRTGKAFKCNYVKLKQNKTINNNNCDLKYIRACFFLAGQDVFIHLDQVGKMFQQTNFIFFSELTSSLHQGYVKGVNPEFAVYGSNN